MRVSGKVAIVTGGAGGIGGEAARVLAREGAAVVITDITDQTGEALAKDIKASYMHLDVASEEQWQAVVAKTLADHGHIDILVNAAGIEGGGPDGSGLGTTLEAWRRVTSINLDGTFLGCKTVMPSMIKHGTGSVINISSIVSYMGTSLLAYGATKGGVEQLSRSLAIIGAKDGKHVRCNSVHPGVIKTRMTDAIFADFARTTGKTDADIEAMLCADVLFGKRGMPIDVANLIVFLASDESSYITGSAFKVDGGWSVVNAG
jgi:NAD(P)-dependent dehydrogenase (short-subunit alcohol dehydrogenase family)